jgi:hypothetical protein
MDTMTANVEKASDNLSSKTVYELKTIAKANGLRGYSRLKKDELLNLITTPRNISTKKELQEIAKERGFKNYTKLTKTKLDAIIHDNTPEHKNTRNEKYCNKNCIKTTRFRTSQSYHN